MAKAKSASAPKRSKDDVDAFLAALSHPLKKDIEAVRAIILGASSDVGEGIKWKAPSFRTSDDFATFNLRSKDRVQLIFHTGAKVKNKTVKVPDPAGLVDWLGKDRCTVTLGAGKEIEARRGALQSLVRAWIKQL